MRQAGENFLIGIKMRQAIVTKYLGPVGAKGSRVKATAYAGSVTLEWDDALNSEDNHKRAATALVKRFNWHLYNVIEGGVMADGNYCFVLTDPKEET
jgi:hypothetical protein